MLIEKKLEKEFREYRVLLVLSLVLLSTIPSVGSSETQCAFEKMESAQGELAVLQTELQNAPAEMYLGPEYEGFEAATAAYNRGKQFFKGGDNHRSIEEFDRSISIAQTTRISLYDKTVDLNTKTISEVLDGVHLLPLSRIRVALDELIEDMNDSEKKSPLEELNEKEMLAEQSRRLLHSAERLSVIDKLVVTLIPVATIAVLAIALWILNRKKQGSPW